MPHPTPDRPHNDTPPATAAALEAAGWEYDNTGGGVYYWRRFLAVPAGDDPYEPPEFIIHGTGDLDDDPRGLDEPALVGVWHQGTNTGASWIVPRLRDFVESFTDYTAPTPAPTS